MKDKTKNRMLIVAFSQIQQYPKDQLISALVDVEEIIILSPYDFVDSFRVRRIIKKTIFFWKSYDSSGLWVTADFLKEHLKSSFGIDALVIKPNLIDLFKLGVVELKSAYTDAKLIDSICSGRQTSIKIQGIESTGFILDSLLRFYKYKPTKKYLINTLKGFRFLLLIKIYNQWLENFLLETQRIESILVNHTVYMESGWVATYLYEKYGTIIKHCQSIQKKLAYPKSREQWFEAELNNSNQAVISSETGKPLNLNWYKEYSIANMPDLRKYELDTSYYLIAMHAFLDANSIHGEPQNIFQSYYNWVSYTLQVARNNKEKTYVFRIHPDSHDFYQDDLLIIKDLFSNLPENIILQDPRKEKFIINKGGRIPVVVTFKGSIAMEMACSGIKAVTVGKPYCPDGTYILPDNLKHYEYLLSGELNKEQFLLTDEYIRQALRFKKAYVGLMK